MQRLWLALCMLLLAAALSPIVANAQAFGWYCHYNLMVNDGDWDIIGNGSYLSGIGMVHTDFEERRGIRLRKFFPVQTRIMEIIIIVEFIRGNVALHNHYLPVTQYWSGANSLPNGTSIIQLHPNLNADSYQFEILSSQSGYAGRVKITSITIAGNGRSICDAPLATATATLTPGGPTPTPFPTATATPTFAYVSATPNVPSQCMYLLPCGAVPWTLPLFPDLVSPTPWSGETLLDPADVPNPTETPTPNPTFPDLDISQLNGAVGTMSSSVSGTQIADIQVDVNGTPVAGSSLADGIDLPQTELFFSYVKGLAVSSFGPFAPIVGWLITWIGLMLLLFLIWAIVKAIGIVIKFVKAGIDLVLGFIPG